MAVQRVTGDLVTAEKQNAQKRATLVVIRSHVMALSDT